MTVRTISASYMMGLLSVVSLFTAVFIILCGAFIPIPSIMAFFLTSLGIAIISTIININWKKSKSLFISISYLIVIFSVFAIRNWFSIHSFYYLLLFIFLQWVVWYRTFQMTNDAKQIRYTLLDGYKVDIILIVFVSVISLVFNVDPTWQTKVLPYFFLFFITRLLAISLSTTPIDAKKQRIFYSVPLIITAASILLGSIYLFFKNEVNHAIIIIISSFFMLWNAVFTLLVWLLSKIKLPIKLHLNRADSILSKLAPHKDKPMQVSKSVDLTHLTYWVLGILILLTVILLLLWILKRNFNQQSSHDSGEKTEVREFIKTNRVMEKATQVQVSPAKTPLRKMYLHILLIMKKRGFPRLKEETPYEFLQRITAKYPQLAPLFKLLTVGYVKERYSGEEINDASSYKDAADQIVEKLSQEE